ncbi:MAG TPA: hypothetical protein VGN37_18865 [Actinocatenispora sp.]
MATFPRRDPDGRVARFGEFVVAAVVWLVVGFVALTVIDVVTSLVGIGDVGSSRGWLAAVLAVWLYAEDFRAWRGVRSRLGIMLIAVLSALLVGGAAGYGLALAAGGLPALVSGSVGAAVGVLVYAPVWYFGIRWVDR